jgi:hypothetical protein
VSTERQRRVFHVYLLSDQTCLLLLLLLCNVLSSFIKR